MVRRLSNLFGGYFDIIRLASFWHVGWSYDRASIFLLYNMNIRVYKDSLTWSEVSVIWSQVIC